MIAPAFAALHLLAAPAPEPAAVQYYFRSLDGRSWEGSAGSGEFGHVPLTGSVLFRTRDGGEHQFSLADTTKDGLTAAMVVTFRWDGKRREYRGTIDDLMPGGRSATEKPQPLSGTFEDRALTLTTESEELLIAGKKGRQQVVFDFTDPDAPSFRMELLRRGETPMLIISGVFRQSP